MGGGLPPRRRAAELFGRLIPVLAGLGLLVGGAAGMQWLVNTSPRPAPITPVRPALPVSAITLQARSVVQPVHGYGTVRSDRYAVIAAEVPGRVVWLAPEAKRGGRVQADHELIRLDAREYESQLARCEAMLVAEQSVLRQLEVESANVDRLLESARSDFDAAEREYRRVKELLSAGNSNPREYDAARRVYEQSRSGLIGLENQKALLPEKIASQTAAIRLREAECELARLNVERCVIRAPFAGQIDAVNVEVGATVSPTQAVLSLLDPEKVEVAIELPASYQDRVRVGAPGVLRVETRAGARWTGVVERLSASADPATRTFSAMITVDNTKQTEPLLVGTFVTAEIAGPLLRDVLVVPRLAVLRDSVFVHENGTAVRKPVRVEHSLGEELAISGLPAGTQVITTNLAALYDGAGVALRDSASDAMSPAVPATAVVPPPPSVSGNSPAAAIDTRGTR
jgi:multidrug resistance efflux pump